MPAPYPIELRIRIVKAYEEGKGFLNELKNIFQVSKTFIQDMLRLYRKTGDVIPKGHGGGAQLKLTEEVLGYIRNLLEKYPDKTEIELSELLEDNYNIKISRASVGRGIRKLGWTRKKKHFMILNERQKK